MPSLNDGSIMPAGKYSGVQMKNVPIKYLDWISKQENLRRNSRWRDVLDYVERNREDIDNKISCIHDSLADDYFDYDQPF